MLLTSVRAGLWTASAVALSSLEVVPPALAVAVLVRWPALRSAWVTVWLAVQVMDSPGSRLASRLPTVLTFGQVSLAVLLSAIVTGPASDTLPLLVTRKL